MFNLGKKLEERAQEVATEMEKDNLEEALLPQGAFSGFLVKDATEVLQKRIEAEAPILGSIISVAGIKYWITLK